MQPPIETSLGFSDMGDTVLVFASRLCGLSGSLPDPTGSGIA